MRKKAPREEGTKPVAEQFVYTPTPYGVAKAWTAHAAAEPYWCMVHEHTKSTPGTKICCDWYTDGAVPCPRCRPAVVPTRVAYVPVWREIDHKPCLVIVHESAEDLLKGVEFGVRVLIGCVERGASVFVKPAPEQSRWVSEHPLRQRPADMFLTLHTLWGYPALAKWEQQEGRGASVAEKVSAADVPTQPGKGVPFPREQLASYFNVEEQKLRDAAERARLNAEFVRNVGPNPNGNGKHKKGGS